MRLDKRAFDTLDADNYAPRICHCVRYLCTYFGPMHFAFQWRQVVARLVRRS